MRRARQARSWASQYALCTNWPVASHLWHAPCSTCDAQRISPARRAQRTSSGARLHARPYLPLIPPFRGSAQKYFLRGCPSTRRRTPGGRRLHEIERQSARVRAWPNRRVASGRRHCLKSASRCNWSGVEHAPSRISPSGQRARQGAFAGTHHLTPLAIEPRAFRELSLLTCFSPVRQFRFQRAPRPLLRRGCRPGAKEMWMMRAIWMRRRRSI